MPLSIEKVYIIGVLISLIFIFTVNYLHPLTTPHYPRPGLTCGGEALFIFSKWGSVCDEPIVGSGVKNVAGYCRVPSTGFKSWKEGVVTTVSPRIQSNCSKLIENDTFAVAKVKTQLKHWNNSVSDAEVLEKMMSCSWVRDYFTDNLYTTRLEKSFPIAFTYVVHNSPQQILRLLRFHYRQHNVYCIHPDKDANNTFMSIFKNISACLGNIIIPDELIRVVWGKASVLEASMNCLKELVKFRERQPESKKWKYVLNLCGKELPLTTNHEIIEYLTSLNGSSNIHAREARDKESLGRLKHRNIPFNLTYYKSMAYNALSYIFVNFVLKNRTAITLYEFFKNCSVADEHYYATVFRIPGVPGGFDPNLSKRYQEIDNYFWINGNHIYCGGKEVHKICVVSVSELKEILRISGNGKKHLFHNKYFMEVDHVVMDCMEERLVARNRLEFKQDCKHFCMIC